MYSKPYTVIITLKKIIIKINSVCIPFPQVTIKLQAIATQTLGTKQKCLFSKQDSSQIKGMVCFFKVRISTAVEVVCSFNDVLIPPLMLQDFTQLQKKHSEGANLHFITKKLQGLIYTHKNKIPFQLKLKKKKTNSQKTLFFFFFAKPQLPTQCPEIEPPCFTSLFSFIQPPHHTRNIAIS